MRDEIGGMGTCPSTHAAVHFCAVFAAVAAGALAKSDRAFMRKAHSADEDGHKGMPHIGSAAMPCTRLTIGRR